MRHAKGVKKLGKATDQRIAMLRSIVRSLFTRGKVKITVTRGKEAEKLAERVIELAKNGDLHSRRMATSMILDEGVVSKVFSEAKARFSQRAGGYTRLTRVGFRLGDAAPMAVLEII